MANRYYVDGGIGQLYWDYSANWSNTSGGAGGAGIPTADDDVFLDANSPAVLNFTNQTTRQCKNLNCTGYTGEISLGFDLGEGEGSAANLQINGDCILSSGMTLSSFIYDYTAYAIAGLFLIFGQLDMDGTTIDTVTFNLYGQRGTIQNITATNVNSGSGKRIYAPGSTLTNCINWTTDSAPAVIHITNAAELAAITDDMSADYILDNDIDLEGVDWTPIGVDPDGIDPYASFAGTFEGQGFTISNFVVSAEKTQIDNYGGLFGQIGNNTGGSPHLSAYKGFVSNLNVEDVTIVGQIYLGGLVGSMVSGDLINCHSKNITITQDPDASYLNLAGGLVGYAFGWRNLKSSIIDCTADGVIIQGKDFSGIGGLFGYANVNSPFSDPLASPEDIIIRNSYAKNVNISYVAQEGDIYGPSDWGIGGLGGYSGGTVQKAFAIGEINLVSTLDYAIEESVGGLIGESGGVIHDVYAKTEINISATGIDAEITLIGGLIGSDNCESLYNFYAAGNVTVDVTDPFMPEYYGIGGAIGISDGAGQENGFYAGIISTTNDIHGGFLGIYYGGISPITNCAWWTGAADNAIGSNLSDLDAWSSLTTYSINQQVYRLNVAYKSLQNGNTNKNPYTQPTWWERIEVPIPLLATDGYGTDEPDNTAFYTTDHPVYAQGT